MTQGRGQGQVSQTMANTNQLTLFRKSATQLGIERRFPYFVDSVLTTTLLSLSYSVMFLTDGSFPGVEPAKCSECKSG